MQDSRCGLTKGFIKLTSTSINSVFSGAHLRSMIFLNSMRMSWPLARAWMRVMIRDSRSSRNSSSWPSSPALKNTCRMGRPVWVSFVLFTKGKKKKKEKERIKVALNLRPPSSPELMLLSETFVRGVLSRFTSFLGTFVN